MDSNDDDDDLEHRNTPFRKIEYQLHSSLIIMFGNKMGSRLQFKKATSNLHLVAVCLRTNSEAFWPDGQPVEFLVGPPQCDHCYTVYAKIGAHFQ